MEILTRTRVEHLPEKDKHKQRSLNPFQDIFGTSPDQTDDKPPEAPPKTTMPTPDTNPQLSVEEYFTEPADREEYDGER